MGVPTTPSPGLRERKKLQTRAALERAALDLAVRRGFDSVTVEDIAAGADVSASTFFRYFESKEAVILQRHMARLAILAENLEASDPGEPIADAGRRGLVVLAKVLSEDRDSVLEMVGAVDSSEALLAWGRARQHVVTSRLAATVASRLGTGLADVRPWLIASNWIAVVAYSLVTWTARGGKGSLQALMTEALAFSEAGFR